MQVPAVDDRPVRPLCKSQMGHLYAVQARFDEAEPLLAEAVARLRASPRTSGTQLGRALFYHGSCLSDVKRFPDAERTLLEAYELLNHVPPTVDRLKTRIMGALVETYESWHAAEPDKGYDAKAAEWRAASRRP